MTKEKEWVREKCGTNTPPKSVPKEAPKIVKRRLTTVKDYDKYIQALKEEAEELHVQLLDMSCNLSALKKQLEIANIERQKITKKVKKTAKETGIKS